MLLHDVTHHHALFSVAPPQFDPDSNRWAAGLPQCYHRLKPANMPATADASTRRPKQSSFGDPKLGGGDS
jgi:hypothetical protein